MHQPEDHGKFNCSLFPMAPSAPEETGLQAGEADGEDLSGASHAPSSLTTDGSIQSAHPTTPADPGSSGASPSGPEPIRLMTRPRQRADCQEAPRPCPWIGCKWHLCWERRDLRRLILSQADPALVAARIMEMDESCVLDCAQAPRSDREVGAVLKVTHQAVAQTCARGLAKLRGKSSLKRGQDESVGADSPPAWRWGGDGGSGRSGGAGTGGNDSGQGAE
jgi:hypothetical protein